MEEWAVWAGRSIRKEGQIQPGRHHEIDPAVQNDGIAVTTLY